MNGISTYTKGFYIYYSDERQGMKTVFKWFHLKYY